MGGGRGERRFLIDSHYFLPVLNSFIIGFFFLEEGDSEETMILPNLLKNLTCPFIH